MLNFISFHRIATPDGMPLYPVSIQSKPVPKCVCGCRRCFEFQIVPTLLSYTNCDVGEINLETLKDEKEWSSVLIYTCEENCDHSQEEVVVLPPF